MRKSRAKKYAYQTNLIGFSYHELSPPRETTSFICFNAHKHTPVPMIDHIYILICSPDICAPRAIISLLFGDALPVNNERIP